ncbi:MAG: methionyl-tRNA formyltransferase [Candidatus Kuenenia sp.]|nr:methionyl-tRNA formyltransferase [Candidatus Kuenenia hertensis]
MNVIFMGTPEFAVPSLSTLAKSTYNVVAVITQPDRPKGRSKTPCPSPVKIKAKELGLEILQPVNVNDEPVIKQLKGYAPDFIVVVAFGQLLSNQIINIPRFKCINIHSSLLPKYRGAAPINWAIIKGETVTGVTSMLMVLKMDAGDIIAQKSTSIFPDENAGELEKRLSFMGAELLLESLDLITTETARYKKQDEKEVTFAPKLKKEDGLISWSEKTQEIHNRIRGVFPAPGAYSFYNKKSTSEAKKRIILLKTHIHEGCGTKESVKPGTIVETATCGIHVATYDGSICITRLQPEGKRAMDAQDFIRGYKIIPQDMFTS